LEDGTMLRITYDAHNGYPYVPVGRILIERNIIPREEMSLGRIDEWMRANPQSAEEVRRQNRSFASPNGGLELAKNYWVSFPDGYRAHQIRLEGGDCSTDSFCYPSV